MGILRRIRMFIRKFYPRGMVNKLFAMICGIGLFLTISLVNIVTGISGNLLYQDTRNLLDNQAKQTVNVFDQYMEILENTVMTASRQDSIQSLIEGNSTGYESYVVYRDAYAYLKSIHEFYDWINIYVVVKNKSYIMSSNPADVTSDYNQKGVTGAGWYKQLEESVRGNFILSDFASPASPSRQQFAYALKIRNIYNWNTQGYIIATIDKTVLNELLKGTNFEKNGFMLVLTEDGKVAYNSDSTIFESDFSLEEIIDRSKGSGSYVLGSNRDYYYFPWKSQKSGWDFIAFADKEYAKTHILSYQILVLIVAAVILFLLIVIARFSAKAYIKPVKRLIKFIHEVEKKEFAGQIDLKLEDEMGDLIHSFNSMIASVRQNQVLRKRAEMDALQKQINPHFLFNTFQSVKALAQQNDTHGVITMIEKLSDMFHYNMSRSRNPMTEIRNEVQHIRNYLDIQRVRFGNRMEVTYDIDDKILSYWTLRFILQPIVENSISHSMEMLKGGFSLDIRGGFDSGDILFVIRDNGAGIPAERLELLKEYIYDRENAITADDFGIGLKNIQERLYLQYGEGYGLTILSAFGEYTEIRIKIAKYTTAETTNLSLEK